MSGSPDATTTTDERLAEPLSARKVHVRSAGSNPSSDINPVLVTALEVVRDIRDDIQARVTALLREILDRPTSIDPGAPA